jgi:predicted RNA-binding protein with PUA-like domain
MTPGHWLVKSEPSKYSFTQLTKDRRTVWDGVRNYEARNHLRAMKQGDLLLYYHSNEDKSVVGVARVLREAYPDPTADDDTWSAIEVGPVVALKTPVTLDALRDHPELAQMMIFKRTRLSVVPVTPAEFKLVLKLGKTKLPAK